ncbi:MAG: LysE family transporter [Chromatiales bacterium]|nr:LysE family transporter [Chromatiales bacterium]
MQIENWLAFCSIAFIATISPGPAILLVITHSLQHGPAKALMTILGNVSGLLVISSASVLGLSSLLLYSTSAFSVVKWVGAVYLIYLGIRIWRSGFQFSAVETGGYAQVRYRGLYSQGLLVALTNPKAIAFATALFPQFIAIDQPVLSQFVILVSTFMCFSFACLLGYAVLAHRLKGRSSQLVSGKALGKVFGSVFIGAGALLATVTQR